MSRRPKLPLEWLHIIADRDKHRCQICDGGYDPYDPWEIDHEIPVARGGRHLLANLRLTHRSCNRKVGSA